MELSGWRRGGFIYVWLMFEQQNFKKWEGKRRKILSGPKREKRERTKLPSVNSASFTIIISEFLTREVPPITTLKRKQDCEIKSQPWGRWGRRRGRKLVNETGFILK